MISMKKTGEKREILDVPVYRVEAAMDMPIYSVKKGDIGGWVCLESTFDGVCWIGEKSVAIKSRIHSSCIISGSHVINSTISNSQIMAVSGVEDSIVNNLFLVDSKLMNSTLESTIHASDEKLETIVFDIGYSHLKNCKIRSMDDFPKNDPSIVLKTVWMETSAIEGKHIRLYFCGRESAIKNTTISGRDVEVASINEMDNVFIEGERIFIENMKKIADSKISVKDFNWNGLKSSLIADTQIKCNDGIVKGEMIWNKLRFDCENLRIETSVESERITLSNTSFWKKTVITGSHIIDKSAFSHGVQLNGQSNMKDVLSTIGMPVLSGEISIEHVSLKGKGIKISDYAKVLGVSGQRVVIRAFVHVSELAFISNQASGSPLVIKGMNVNSDTKITA